MADTRLRRIERGIYKDWRDGRWEIYVRVKPLPLKHRSFPSELSIRDIRAKRDAIKRELQRAAKHERAAGGTVAADAPAFLNTFKSNLRRKSARGKELDTWLPHIGHLRRHDVTPDQLQAVLEQWAADGYAYQTIRHRRAALLAFYDRLDLKISKEERPDNPVRETKIPIKKPRAEPRGLPLVIVLQILDAVSQQGGVVGKGDPLKPKGERGGRNDVSLTRIRIHIMAFTGLRHSELKRYQPEDWRRSQCELVVRAGKDCLPRVIPLLPDAERWLEQLEREHATGDFNNGVVNRAFRRALAKVGLAPAVPRGTWSRQTPRVRRGAVPGVRRGYHAHPRGRTGLIRPYDLRHSILTALTIVTGSTDAAQWQAGHTSSETTQRYNLNAVPFVQRVATAKLADAIDAARAEAKTGTTKPGKARHSGARLR